MRQKLFEKRVNGRRGSSQRQGGGRVARFELEALERRQLLSAVVWSVGPNLPSAVGGASSLVGPGVLVFGGNSRNVYDLLSGSFSWTNAVSFDTNIISPGLSYIPGNTILVYGGSPGSGATNSAMFYDPSNPNALDSAANMSTSRKLLAYATDSSLRAYAIGGINNSGTRLATAERFTEQSGAWTSIASLPAARSGASAVYDNNGHILLFGGATNALAATTDVLEYTVSSNSWSTLASMPTATTEAAAVLGSDGNFYVIGGLSAAGAAQSAVQVYNLSTNIWSSGTALPYAVSNEAAVSNSVGSIVVLGGKDASHAAISTVTVSQELNQPLAAPVFTSTAPTQVSASGIYTYQVTTNANPLATFSLTTAPAGMTINPNSGLLTWAVPAGLVGTQNVTVQASNIVGSNSQSFSFTLAAPTITTTSLKAASANASYTATIAATANPTAAFSLTAAPAGMTIDASTGILSWSPTLSDVGNQSVTVQATNSVGSTLQTYTLGVAGLPPANVTGAGYSTSAVQISWSPVSDPGGATYDIYRQTFTHSPKGSGGTYHYTLLGTGITGTSAIIGGLAQSSPGSAAYAFVVTSVDNQTGLESAYSNVAYAATWYPPDIYNASINGAVFGSPIGLQVDQTLQVQLDYYANPTPNFTMTNAPASMSLNAATGLITFTPTQSDIGSVTVNFTGTNPAGSSSYPITFNVSADTTAPTVTIATPGNLFPYNTPTPLISGTAGHGLGDSPTVTLNIYAGTTATGTPVETLLAPVNASTGAYSLPANALADGTYTVQATQSDLSNNLGTSAAVTFIVDTVPPTLTMATPIPGSYGAYVYVSGTASTAPLDGAFVLVELYAGATVDPNNYVSYAYATVDRSTNPGNWYTYIYPPADGQYTLQASLGDSAGNYTYDAPVTFTADVTPPVVGISSPVDSSIVGNSNVTISGTAGILNGDSSSVEVDIYDSAWTLLQTLNASVNPSTGAYSVSAGAMDLGQYIVQASQGDAAGNVGTSAAVTFTVALAGDANLDGQVTGADYTIWADHYGMTGQTWTTGDFNGDGKVTGADYTYWADSYGKVGVYYTPAAAPAAAAPALAAAPAVVATPAVVTVPVVVATPAIVVAPAITTAPVVIAAPVTVNEPVSAAPILTALPTVAPTTAPQPSIVLGSMAPIPPVLSDAANADHVSNAGPSYFTYMPSADDSSNLADNLLAADTNQPLLDFHP